MSTLGRAERLKVEKLLEMSGGYVSDFSNRTFGDFFVEEIGVDIDADVFQVQGTSKANRLRAFLKSADDATAGKALMLLIDYQVEARPASPIDLVEECRDIARRLLAGTPNLATLSQTASEFDAVVLQKQIERMSQSVDTDPALAIGTAKELVETCCKTILMDWGASLPGQPDMSTLSKAVMKELQLVPEAIPEGSRGERVIKRLLSNLATVGNGLAELRGLYGTGHGPEAGASGLQPRHARLAVGASAALATFLFETHEEKRQKQS